MNFRNLLRKVCLFSLISFNIAVSNQTIENPAQSFSRCKHTLEKQGIFQSNYYEWVNHYCENTTINELAKVNSCAYQLSEIYNVERLDYAYFRCFHFNGTRTNELLECTDSLTKMGVSGEYASYRCYHNIYREDELISCTKWTQVLTFGDAEIASYRCAGVDYRMW
ncbi:MAG: hypothetical protein ABIA04_06815 [Pseudomonadota bacterium]